MKHGLRHIRAFLTVAELSNFTKAAEKLCISGSTLTLQIQQLESELGVILFDRNKRHVALTSEGQKLLIPLKSVLQEYDYALHLSKNMSEHIYGTIRIAVLPTIASTLLPQWIKEFKLIYPKIKFIIYDLNADEIRKYVKDGIADIGIGTAMELESGLQILRLFDDELDLFLHSSHPLLQQDKIYLNDVVHYPNILTLPGSSVYQLFKQSIEQIGYSMASLDIACEVRYLSTAISMINNDIGVAVLPKSTPIASYLTDVTQRKIIDFTHTRTICIMQLSNHKESIVLSQLTEIMLEKFELLL